MAIMVIRCFRPIKVVLRSRIDSKQDRRHDGADLFLFGKHGPKGPNKGENKYQNS